MTKAVVSKACDGCGEKKEVFLTETPNELNLCANCLRCIWNDRSLKDDVERACK